MKLVLNSLALLCVALFASVALAENHSANHTTITLPTFESAAASDGSFGNGTALVPIWKGVVAEGLWYYSQGRNIGFAGVGYKTQPRPWLILVPSAYLVRGNGEHDLCALGVRAVVETKRFLGDLNVIRTFGGGVGEDRDIFVDPSHLSARIRKLQVGYGVEFFRHIGESHTAENYTAASAAAHTITPPTPTKGHKPEEWLHGPRVGWEINSRVHVFYFALYKGNGRWEHKSGMAFYVGDILRKRK